MLVKQLLPVLNFLFLYLIILVPVNSQNLVWQEILPHPKTDSLSLQKFTLNDTLFYYHTYDNHIVFWKYDEIGENWDSSISIPVDTIVSGQYLFTIKDKIYHGLAYSPRFEDVVTPNLKVWEIDINKREIKQLKDSPAWFGFNRPSSKGTIQNKGYICGGKSGPYRISLDDYNDKCYDGCWSNQFWLYDPMEDRWIQKKDLPEILSKRSGRHDTKTFIIDNELYMMGGEMNNSWEIEDYYVKDLWKYDFSKDDWIKLEDDPPTYAIYGVGGYLDTLGYIGLGYPELPGYNEPLKNRSNKMYLYHPSTGWLETTSFPESMEDNYSAVIKGNSVGFVQTKDKLWKFALETITSVKNPANKSTRPFPNPVHKILYLVEGEKSQVQVVIYSTRGEILYSNKFQDASLSIDLSHVTPQLLIIQLIADENSAYHKVLKL